VADKIIEPIATVEVRAELPLATYQKIIAVAQKLGLSPEQYVEYAMFLCYQFDEKIPMKTKIGIIDFLFRRQATNEAATY
jgi:hypothetical protein